MADIRIAKPAAGIAENIPSEPGARFVFEFPTTEATLLRDGDNLVINFSDGSQISLQDFYTEYDEENLPSFVMDDVEVEAQDFFTAMNEPDLMPAAGPATGAEAADNARYHAYDDMALASGIDHLWQLDWNMRRGFDHEETPNSVGPDNEGSGQVNTLIARAEIPAADTPVRDSPIHDTPSLRPETPVDRPVYEPVYRPEPTPPVDSNNPSYEPVVPPTTPPDAYEPPYEPVVPPTTPPTTPSSPEDEDKPGPDPEPKNEEPDVEVPLVPEKPEEKDPDPDKPEDPEDPVVPGEPNTPDGTGFVPITGKSHVVVDEGAMKNDAGEAIGNHTMHGAEGEAHFNVHIPVEEGGTITLDFGQGTMIANLEDILANNAAHIDGGKIVFTIGSNGSTVQMTAGEGLAFLTHDGVLLSNFRPVYDGDGNWHVDYDYQLTGNQWHDKGKPYNGNFEDDSHSNPTLGDSDKDINNDGLIFDSKAVHITVKDTKGGEDGTGDVRHDWISVEVHDDVPVLSSVENTNTAEQLENDSTTTQITGKLVDLNFGADYAVGEVGLNVTINGVEFKGTQDADGKWSFAPQGDKTDASEVGSFVLNEDLTFVYTRPEGDLDDNLAANTYKFDVQVVDSDKDVAPGSMSVLIFGKPTFEPDPYPDPDPDPDDPSNPKLPENAISHVVTDDSGLSTGAQTAEKGDTESATDTSKFVVNMNGHKLGVAIGESANGLVLEFDAQGNLVDESGNKLEIPESGAEREQWFSDNFGGHQINSEYGNMIITDVHADTTTNKLTIEYKFTQTKNCEKHDINEDSKDADGNVTTDHTDEHAANVDRFDVTLYDREHNWNGDGSADKGHIYVSIEDDAPTQIDLGQDQLDLPDWTGNREVVDAEGNAVKDENGDPVTRPGTDTITIPVSGLNIGADLAAADDRTAEVSINLTGKDNSQITNVTFKATLDDNGEYVFTPDGGNASGLSLVNENGQWQIKYDRPANDKSNWTNNEYNFEVKVTDSDGDFVSDTVKVTTYAKPNFVDPKEPGEPGEDPAGDPYKFGATVSEVSVDESWLAPDAATLMPGGTAYKKENIAASDQLTPEKDAEADAVSASARSSFAVSLNGNAYAITIGEGESALTLSFDGDGNFQKATSNGQKLESWKEVTEHQVNGEYGDFRLAGEAPTVTSDGRLKFEYEYTQTRKYDHAEGENTFDQVQSGADQFQLVVQDTVKGDSDGRVTGNIKVNIEDDAPEAGTVTPAEGFTGSFDVNFGADQSADIPFTYKDANGRLVEAQPSEVIKDAAGNITSGTYMLAVEGGSLELTTTDGKTFNYKFNPDDAHKDQTFEKLNFKINAIDGDGDQRQIEVSFSQNHKPTLDPDPTKPGEDPTPDPKDPENPDGIPADPATNEMQIIVDEAAFADRNKGENDPEKGGTGDSKHSWHGTGSFNVQFNGHENGLVMLGQGDRVYLIEISTNEKGYETGVKYYAAKTGADGKVIYDVEHQVAQKGVEITDLSTIKFMDNGVEVTLGAILKNEQGNDELHSVDAVSTNGNTGKYQIHYSYELKNVVEHNDPDKVPGDTEKNTHNPIQIVVKDETGDIDTGKITIEVHDDGPVIQAVKTGTGDDQSVVDNAVIFRYGADDRDPFDEANIGYHKVTVSGGNQGTDDDNRLELTTDGNILWTIYDENGQPTEKTSDDISKMKEGEIWQSGEVQITKSGNEHKFDYVNKESADNAKHNFTVKIVDADGDSETATIKLGAPTLDIPKVEKDEENPDADPTTGNAHIVVDEGYLTGGNIKHGHEAGTAKEPIPGSFTFTLPGEEGGEITLAVPGVENGETVKFTIGTDGTTITQVEGENTSFTTSNGVVIEDFGVVKSGTEGEYTVNYKYYLTGKQDHADPAEASAPADTTGDFTDNNVKFDFNAIEVTVKDGTGDTVKGQINVEVHDDEPVVTDKDDVNFTFTERAEFDNTSEEYAGQQTGKAEFDVAAGADDEKSASYSLDIADGQANTGLKAFVDGNPVDIVLEKGTDGIITGKAGGKDVFTVELGEDGQVIMKQTSGGPGIYHPKTTEANQINENVTLKGIQVNKVVTDQDGDSDTGTVNVVINIEDLKPELSATQGQSTIETSNPLMLDFLKGPASSFEPTIDDNGNTVFGSWSEIKDDSRFGYSSEIKFIGTFVGYDMDAEGHITWFMDRNSNLTKKGNTYENFDGGFYDNKIVLSENGLGVGRGTNKFGENQWDGANDKNGNDMGISFSADALSSTENHAYDKAHSQAISIEADKNQVFYGLDIKLSNFEPQSHNRAVIVFYQTPRYSNDDSIVKIVEVDPTSELVDKDGKIVVDVPDGFTKAIIAPIPTQSEWTNTSENKTSNCHFSIEQLAFTKTAIAHHGQVKLDAAGDDAGVKDITWDLSEMENGLVGHEIKIEGTVGAGTYKVEKIISDDGKTVNFKLANGQGTDFKLDGNDLFNATLNEDGSWVINQFYKFKVDDKDPAFNTIKFSVIDKDGSKATTAINVDLTLESSHDRFDNVELGYHDGTWEHYAWKDNAMDVLTGKGTNDLVYGNGGNDILFGDKLDADGFATLGKLVGDNSWTWNPDTDLSDNYNKNTPLAEQEAGINETRGSQKIWNYLKTADEAALDNFQSTVDNLGSNHGDDALFGGVGDDILFGGKGNDYLDGTGDTFKAAPPNGGQYSDKNMLFGGAGNDIILLNKGDVLVHGGDDADLLLYADKNLGTSSNENTLNLKQLLLNSEKVKYSFPKVYDVEVLLQAGTDDVGKLGITSLSSLAKYGVAMEGKNVIIDNSKWKDTGWPDNNTGEYAIKRYEYTTEEGVVLKLDVAYKQVTTIFGTVGSYGKDEMQGTQTDDVLYGLDGNDALYGDEGNDTLQGGAGNDYLDGGEGSDNIFAGSGNDVIRYDENDIAINGGSGIDLIIAGEDSPSLEKLLEGPKDDDSVPQPIVNNVELMLKVDKETEEELNIRNLADVAALGIVVSENDIIVDTGKWEQIVQDNPSGKTVKFEGQTESGHKMILEVAKEGDHKIFTKTDGDAVDNVLNGDDLANIMHGMDGDDQLFGGLGDDKLYGDAGNDYLDGGEGRDWIDGGEGADIILLDPSDYLIDGGDDEIDFILSTDKNASLAQMLENGANPDSTTETPMVRDVEVLVSGNVENIKSVEDLADKGIHLDETKTGISLSKDSGWMKYQETDNATPQEADKASSASATHKYYNEQYDLVVETTVPVEDEGFEVYVPAQATTVAEATTTGGTDVVPADETGGTSENSTDEKEESSPDDSQLEEGSQDEVQPGEEGNKAENPDSGKDNGNTDDLTEKNGGDPEKPSDFGEAGGEKPAADETKTEDPADKILADRDDADTPVRTPEPQDKSAKDDSGKDLKDDSDSGEKQPVKSAATDTLHDSKSESGESSGHKESDRNSDPDHSTSKGAGSDSHDLPTTSGAAEADIMASPEPVDTGIMEQIAAATSQVLADSGNGLG